MRRALSVIGVVNLVALGVSFLIGGIPAWPDIHTPPITGTPLIEIAGADISISNSLVTMWIVMAVLVLGSFLLTRNMRLIPGRRQGAVEMVVQTLVDFVTEVGGREALRHLPLFGTLFLFILVSNWLGILPFVGQIELLHGPTADYHVNAGLALTAFGIYQFHGVRKSGPGYFGRFVNFGGFKEGALMGVIMLFVGFVEFFSELFRILSLTLRLFGNIWGGEVSLAVISSLVVIPALALPFIGLEIFIGLIQALIFSLLVLIYIVLALETHGDDHGSPGNTAHHEMSQEVAHA